MMGRSAQTDHKAVAEQCRANRGEWVPVRVYAVKNTATVTVHYIRTAKKLPYYAPAGTFDARKQAVPGGWHVYARYK